MKKLINRRHNPYSKFKAWLDERGIRQKELAELLEKSITAVNQNLNGTGGDFSITELRVICDVYKISADEFFINNKVSYTKLF